MQYVSSLHFNLYIIDKIINYNVENIDITVNMFMRKSLQTTSNYDTINWRL